MGLFSRRMDRRIAAYQRELIETHYQEVENMYRQIRGWRHDYRNHIQVLKSYALADNKEAVLRYLDDLGADLNTVDTVVKTGNTMADAILNSKISLAKSKGINVIVSANIPLALKMTDVDLCIIIGNLMDNAIEANMALPEEERMIRVYMDMKNTQLYISVTNRSKGKKQKQSNGRFLSSKGSDHGFGLVRIDNVVERYGGYIRRGSEKSAFTTEILLPQE